MSITTYADGQWIVVNDDCKPTLATLEEGSVDSIVTDPPYELGFMGKKWDGTGIAYDVELWAECLRVLKPGGHLLAFGGSRTWHRMAVAIDDAGFELRDSIAWLYGSGFPKSLDVSKAIDKAAGAERAPLGIRGRSGKARNSMTGDFAGEWDITAPATDEAKRWQGWGTALKPSHEPIVVARKPLAGTVAANVLEHGTGALNIDGCRIPSDDGYEKAWDKPVSVSVNAKNAVIGNLSGSTERRLADLSANKPSGGRWPTNVVLDESQAAELDAQTGILTSGLFKGHRTSDKTCSTYGAFKGDPTHETETYGDSGGASRFFPTFKYQAKAPSKERPKVDGVVHPTVKPLALVRWLVRLVTPPGGWVLDPFAGSGTTGEAAYLEGFRCLLIEREADYLPLIEHRFNRVSEEAGAA